MRLQITITELAPAEWDSAQRVLMTDYEFTESTNRVCLTLEHQGEERHVEMPLGSFLGLALVLAAVRPMEMMSNVARTAQAALTPDALPDNPAEKAENTGRRINS